MPGRPSYDDYLRSDWQYSAKASGAGMDESHLPEFSKLHDALTVVCDFLDAYGFPYALAGGMAVAVWGEPRATFDVDLVVAIGADLTDKLLSAIRAEPAFIMEPQSLPMPPEINIVRAHLLDKSAQPPAIILVDLLLVSEQFAVSLRSRRVEVSIAAAPRWVCSAEDLIVLKLLSGRVKDLEDVRGIRRVQQESIDEAYVQTWAVRLHCEDIWRSVLP
jgi:hypothetical protein